MDYNKDIFSKFNDSIQEQKDKLSQIQNETTSGIDDDMRTISNKVNEVDCVKIIKDATTFTGSLVCSALVLAKKISDVTFSNLLSHKKISTEGSYYLTNSLKKCTATSIEHVASLSGTISQKSSEVLKTLSIEENPELESIDSLIQNITGLASKETHQLMATVSNLSAKTIDECNSIYSDIETTIDTYKTWPPKDSVVGNIYQQAKTVARTLLGDTVAKTIVYDLWKSIFKNGIIPTSYVAPSINNAQIDGLIGQYKDNLDSESEMEELKAKLTKVLSNFYDGLYQQTSNAIKSISKSSEKIHEIESSGATYNLENATSQVKSLSKKLQEFGCESAQVLSKHILETIFNELNSDLDQSENVISLLSNFLEEEFTDEIDSGTSYGQKIVERTKSIELELVSISASSAKSIIDAFCAIGITMGSDISNDISKQVYIVDNSFNLIKNEFSKLNDSIDDYVDMSIEERKYISPMRGLMSSRDDGESSDYDKASSAADWNADLDGDGKSDIENPASDSFPTEDGDGGDDSEWEDGWYNDAEDEQPDDGEDGNENDEGDDNMGGSGDGDGGDDGDDEDGDDDDDNGDDADSVTNPMNADALAENDNITIELKDDWEMTPGWKGFPPEVTSGIKFLMHDGDQQLFNPYGHEDGRWTIYSFRPADAADMYPQIAITPASFEALDSMETMLNSIPYVVVREFFFKNTASQMANFVEKIKKVAQEALESVSPGSPAEAPSPQTEADKSSQGAGDTKSTGNGILDKIKEKFQNISQKTAVIDIPYVLYCQLRKKLYGNTYVFPYIVNSSTIINQANNSSEWGENGSGSIMDAIKNGINNMANMVGGLATALTGSSGTVANLFPAPTWGGPNSNQEKVSFQFDLMLINDNAIKTRNNYMCVNTIIHNNRYIQKAILAFPGALYEIWLPTGQRHLMCTCDLKLHPLGLNRKAPKNLFSGIGAPAENNNIGTQSLAKLLQNHEGGSGSSGGPGEREVIPDGYKLGLTFSSCLPNNMNTSVFQYYVKMTDYKDEASHPGSESADLVDEINDTVFGGTDKKDAEAAAANQVEQKGRENIQGEFRRAVEELASNNGWEKFDESTYNKKIGKLKTSLGDVGITSDSAVSTIRKSQEIISESTKFLEKLYNAPNNNLWYKPFEWEEYYTTLEPNYQQILRKRYQNSVSSLIETDKNIQEAERGLDEIQTRISESKNFDERDYNLKEKVYATKRLFDLKNKREALVGDILQIDTDLIQVALDYEDNAVSVGKNEISEKIFQQVWNEKIMNSYEQDKIQYMTSQEKTEYFNDKIRDLQKYDTFGILNHSDWFYRIVVLDYIVEEMQRLILIFKSCTYDDFETIYKIVRKLNLLILDFEQIHQAKTFNINTTNLFYISDDFIKKFTKIDKLLSGNTLYELFKNQLKLVVTTKEIPLSNQTEIKPTDDKALVVEQKSEQDIKDRRKIRQEIVTRYWGSESELTKRAYAIANESVNGDSEETTTPLIVDGVPYEGGITALKNRIITLKLNNKQEEQGELKALISEFTNYIRTIKEGLVIQKMHEIHSKSSKVVERNDADVNAKISEEMV